MFNFSGITNLTEGKTRLFTAENVYGEKGKGGMAAVSDTPQPEVEKIGQVWEKSWAAHELGQKWKVRPCITLPAKTTTTIMDTEGPGRITHIWMTVDPVRYRDIILRMYWDGEENPSVETPLGDFFCCGFAKPMHINAIPISVHASGGLNCYFPMPFRKHAKITVENRAPNEHKGFFYAISMDEDLVGPTEAYFHAKFRRTNPLPYMEDYLIIDGIEGKGHFVGTQMCWQQNTPGWWGEGEFKAFIDDDTEFPTYCGTGTEDYFGGAWGFCANYSGPFLGYQDMFNAGVYGQENKRDVTGLGNRHNMYRFHLLDPIRFQKNFKATMQALGWRSEGRYWPLMDDIASVAYWYQSEPHVKFEELGSRNDLEAKS